MRWDSKSDSVLLLSLAVFCIIIVWNLTNRFGRMLPFRVNCWFCNKNIWVNFPKRNCWTCPSCDQYNGFTKDGDYNRPLPVSSKHTFKSPRRVRTIRGLPLTNGLCHMCNINQQLKVAQLANFVPISNYHFDKEVETYKSQLEKAYKLCLQCRRYLKSKLLKEKESLGSKLIESHLSKKANLKNPVHRVLTKVIKCFFMAVTFTLIILILRDCYKYIFRYKYITTLLAQTKQVFCSLFVRLMTIFQAKLFLTFPILQYYDNNFFTVYTDYYNQILRWTPYLNLEMPSSAKLQKKLSGIGCLLQIVCHLCNQNIVKCQAFVDTIWAVLLVAMLETTSPTPVLLLFKLSTSTALVLAYNSASVILFYSTYTSPRITSKMKMKNLLGSANELSWKHDSTSGSSSEDDVSLSQYGIDHSSSFNDESFSERSFVTNKIDTTFSKNMASIWSIPSHNSTFRSSIFEPIYNGRSFPNNYFNSQQKMDVIDSDSGLDYVISGLNLGTSPRKSHPHSNIFAIKKFDRPIFAVPSVNNHLISPGRLGQGTSWIAGGYWGDEGTRAHCEPAASRSSSQSSGIESLPSKNFQCSVFCHPPALDNSVCSELDRTSVFSYQTQRKCSVFPNSSGHVASPGHAQMRYDNYIHIPQPFVSSTQPVHTTFDRYSQESKLSVPHGFSKIRRSSHLIKLSNLPSA